MSTVNTAFVDSLLRSQWLTPAQLERYQRPLIERLIRHAATQTSYYPERLKAMFSSSDLTTARVDMSRWSDIPILTRAEAFDHGEQLKARTVPPDSGHISEGKSSGSTGQPLAHLRSGLADTAANCHLDRVFTEFGLDLHGSFGWIATDFSDRFEYPGHRGGWDRPGPLSLLNIRTSAADQLTWIERNDLDLLMSYANNLRSIAEVAADRDPPPKKLKAVISTGETLTPETRSLIATTFGTRVIDLYGAREIGQVAFECPQFGGYHFCSDIVICELVGEDGQPVNDGEMGRVVVTPLYNYAMPFIRYDLGDYAVRSGAPCRCGRGLQRIDRIVGRTRHLFVMPDGSRKWPDIQGTAMQPYFGFRQLQVVQTELNSVEVRYVPLPDSAPIDRERVAAHLEWVFHQGIAVTLTPVGRIERNAGEKYEEFISLI